MPIRPIDMQVLLPKSQNVSNKNQSMLHKAENIVQSNYNENKQANMEKLKKVNNIEKKENHLITRKKEENNNFLKENKKRNKKQSCKDEKNSKLGQNIDIKV
ncbi:hypothetical protein SAMN02745883_00129 [Caminicella sporogenes DSM 14501]|uniref:Uncharacterized protein n=1 Tax=Caminicella sporogenes DSM 14501 TaxID=1121266 RepID=A0A1M6LA15_9FIRM|nr:hypothetical protein [Caminicella sporogenes]RKD27758.1 hypothetical protein BET04_01445 [Caminicella sporogenes]SHJ67985.1 hypothetical protein SAMN02745883_00129 [Caminicella sporogenes DSM 14501]